MSSVKTMRANAVLVFDNSVFADELEIKPVPMAAVGVLCSLIVLVKNDGLTIL